MDDSRYAPPSTANDAGTALGDRRAAAAARRIAFAVAGVLVYELAELARVFASGEPAGRMAWMLVSPAIGLALVAGVHFKSRACALVLLGLLALPKLLVMRQLGFAVFTNLWVLAVAASVLGVHATFAYRVRR